MLSIFEDSVVMTPELTKTIIATASERQVGMKICVTCANGRSINKVVTIRATKPGCVVVKADGRRGFNVNGESYLTENKGSGDRFLAWLKRAKAGAINGEDYGHPDGCDFWRC
jgi:hypothetical protein